jgi:hypothetical protein
MAVSYRHQEYIDPFFKEREVVTTWNLLNRFRGLLTDYFAALVYEFLPTEKTCDEWRDYMLDLQHAVACIVNHELACDRNLLSCQPTCGDAPRLTDLIARCDQIVAEATDCIEDESTSEAPGEKIVRAIRVLQKLVDVLDHDIFKNYSVTGTDQWIEVWPEEAKYSKDEYEKVYEGLKRYLEGAEPATIECFKNRYGTIQIDEESSLDFPCTISRLVFLKASFFAFMAPNEWRGGKLFRELVEIQERVHSEKLSTPSPHRYNVGHRILMIRQSKLLSFDYEE